MSPLLIYKSCISVFVLICGIISFFWLKKIKELQWLDFASFLVFLGIFDMLGIALSRFGYMNESQRLYVFLIIPSQIIVYIYVLVRGLRGFGANAMKVALSIYLVSFLIEIVLKDAFANFTFTSFSYIIGNIILLLLVLVYFYELTSTNRILNFFNERMFWIGLGLLIFWFGSLPYYGLFNYMRINYMNLMIRYCWVVMTLNYVMYGLFMVGLLWAKKN